MAVQVSPVSGDSRDGEAEEAARIWWRHKLVNSAAPVLPKDGPTERKNRPRMS